ncbi:MAG: class I SAM-dependent methyltransferase [Planctomycetota bacterium]
MTQINKTLINQSKKRYLENDFLWRLLQGANGPGPMRDWRVAELQAVTNLIVAMKKKVRVIDFGCGDGRHLIELGSMFDLAVGIDLDPEPLRIARENVVGQSGFQFLRRNMECPERVLDSDDKFDIASELPSVPKFDLAMCLWSSAFAAEPTTVFQAMKRQVVPGGLVLLTAYGEKSVPWRLGFYEAIGEGKSVATPDGILMASGSVSAICTPELASKLFGEEIEIDFFANGEGLLITHRLPTQESG